MKDSLQEFGELGLGSRLNRLSEYLMKETQIIYNRLQIDFDPYLFPIFKIIVDQKKHYNFRDTRTITIHTTSDYTSHKKASNKGFN